MAEDKTEQSDLVGRPSKATPVEGTVEPVEMPSVMGATFAERAAANRKASGKAVQTAENKAVTSGTEAKAPRRRR